MALQMARRLRHIPSIKALNDKSEPNLAHEVAELRKEIAALRAELAPVPSLIVTGRQALDEFKRLTHSGP